MAHIHREALVPYSAKNMFALVDDVDAYPQFLPWCRSATVHQREGNEVRASIQLAKGSVNKTFSTLNVAHGHERMDMSLLEGPFKHLQGHWRFQALSDDASKVSLELDFEFSNKLVALAIGPIFNQIANTLVDAFVQRARQVYR